LLSCLKPGGEITLATNIRDYFEEAIEFGTTEWKLELVERGELIHPNVKRPRTHFEKKYLARGETCLNVIFQKTAR